MFNQKDVLTVCTPDGIPTPTLMSSCLKRQNGLVFDVMGLMGNLDGNLL
jgi:hypothetical protein